MSVLEINEAVGESGRERATSRKILPFGRGGRPDLAAMLHALPGNVPACEPNDLRIVYANRKSRDTLRSIERLPPVTADGVLGQSVDVFHKTPQRQRAWLADPNNLPHRVKISLGDEILDLHVAPIVDASGVYTGPMLIWSVCTEEAAVADEAQTVARSASDAAGVLKDSAADLTKMADATKDIADQVRAMRSATDGSVQGDRQDRRRDQADCRRRVSHRRSGGGAGGGQERHRPERPTGRRRV